MMEIRSIAELTRLVSAGSWKAAERYAKDIAFECRMNYLEENPPLLFRSIPRRSIPHPHRIRELLCRVSRKQVIWAHEANEITLRLANKWSGNPSLTYEAARLKEGRWFSEHSWQVEYYANGTLNHATFVWDELFTEAIKDQRKFIMLSARRERVLRALRRMEEKSLSVKTLINRTKKELTNHVKDIKDGGRYEGVSREHHAWR